MATASLGAALSTAQTKRIEEAASVLTELHAVPDKDVPQELWDKAACVMVVPGMKKAAFVFGGEYGKGKLLRNKVSLGAEASVVQARSPSGQETAEAEHARVSTRLVAAAGRLRQPLGDILSLASQWTNSLRSPTKW